jgi:hypothetical protein
MRKSAYPEWDMYSRLLTNKEHADPNLVLEELFDFAHLPEWRNILWDWLKITVSGSYNTETTTPSERASILFVYEKLQRLIEASHLIHLQQQALRQTEKEKERHIF